MVVKDLDEIEWSTGGLNATSLVRRAKPAESTSKVGVTEFSLSEFFPVFRPPASHAFLVSANTILPAGYVKKEG